MDPTNYLIKLVKMSFDYHFNYFIAIVFVIGLLSIWIKLDKLRNATKAINDFQKYTNRTSNEKELDQEINKTRNEFAKDALRERFDIIAHNKNSSNFNISAISEIFWSKQNSNFWDANLPKYISKGLVLLGLLGTVGGLILSLSELNPVLEYMKDTSGFNIADFQLQFTEHFSKALAGMDIAFTSTLIGIVLSVILSLIILFNDSLLVRFCALLDEITISLFMPVFMSKENETNLLLNKIESMQTSFENSASVLDETARAFGTHIYNFGLYSEKINSNGSELKSLIKDYYENVINDIKTRVSALDEIQEQVANSLSNFEDISSMLKNIQENTSKTVEKAADSISSVNENLKNTCSKFDKLSEEFRTDQQTLLERLSILTEGVNGKFSFIENESRAIIDNLDKLNKSINQNKDSLQSYLNSLAEEHNKSISRYYDNLLNQLNQKLDDQFSNLYKDSLNQFLADLNSTSVQIQSLLTTYQSILEDVQVVKSDFSKEEMSRIIVEELNNKNTQIIEQLISQNLAHLNQKFIEDHSKLCGFIEDLKKSKEEEISYHKKLFDHFSINGVKN